MATPSDGPADCLKAAEPVKGYWDTEPLADRLFREGFAFDFFQAVRLLEKLHPDRIAIGHTGEPDTEVVRLRPRQALDFPPSTIFEIRQPTAELRLPVMTVCFMGMTGTSGVLPRHYTELILRQEREGKGQEKVALREWLDLFNHRFLSHFYRAWEKYRVFPAFERGEFSRREPDAFTRCLFSLMGLGLTPLRNRLRVSLREVDDDHVQEKVLAHVPDLALLRFSGFLAHRPRCAVSLEAMLAGYLRLPVEVHQHQGQWIRLEDSNQTSLGALNNAMGQSVVVGDRIWNIQSKIRVRLGPLSYPQFLEYLPDRAPIPQRKAIFLLAQMVRLYTGPEVDVEIQLVLKADEVPFTRMGRGPGASSRLGWNTWGRRLPMRSHGDEAVFQADERVWLETAEDAQK